MRTATLVMALALASCGRTEPTAKAPPVTGSPATDEAPPAPEIVTAEPLAPGDSGEPPPVPADIRWVALGAADGPWSNQLSIEDELLAVAARLGDGGVTLYAGGAGSAGVQVADPAPRGSALTQTLGAILDPRAGRDAHYQALRARPHDASSYAALERVLQAAVAPPGPTPPRLTVWIAGHGAGADAARDVTVPVWFGDALLPEELARALTGPRPFRLVQTTCFSGAFAELVIDQPNRACGAFATRWNLEASGCDPSAAARDSYGAMLLGDGAGDLDGNGAIGLSERHVRAAIDGPGIEVPLLSSQVWLEREVGDVPADTVIDQKEPLLAEERGLLAGLLARGKLTADELPARFDALAGREEAALAEQAAAAQEAEALRLTLVSELVRRWPAIEDPWHPDFQPTLVNEGAAIDAWLAASPTVAKWRLALGASDALDTRVHALELELAVLDRAMVARDTMLRAAVAKAGIEGSTWATFAALRACEREALP